MLKHILLAILTSLLLFFVPPTFATTYTASVELDLAGLTFSGIPVTFSTVIPPGTFDPFLFDTTAEQRNTFISAGTAVSSHDVLSTTWQKGTTVD